MQIFKFLYCIQSLSILLSIVLNQNTLYEVNHCYLIAESHCKQGRFVLHCIDTEFHSIGNVAHQEVQASAVGIHITTVNTKLEVNS